MNRRVQRSTPMTHFSPPKFLEFAEQAEGRPFPLIPLYKSLPALTEVPPKSICSIATASI